MDSNRLLFKEHTYWSCGRFGEFHVQPSSVHRASAVSHCMRSHVVRNCITSHGRPSESNIGFGWRCLLSPGLRLENFNEANPYDNPYTSPSDPYGILMQTREQQHCITSGPACFARQDPTTLLGHPVVLFQVSWYRSFLKKGSLSTSGRNWLG